MWFCDGIKPSDSGASRMGSTICKLVGLGNLRLTPEVCCIGQMGQHMNGTQRNSWHLVGLPLKEVLSSLSLCSEVFCRGLSKYISKQPRIEYAINKSKSTQFNLI